MTSLALRLVQLLLLGSLTAGCAGLKTGAALDAELAAIRAQLPGAYEGPSPSPWDPSVTLQLQHVFAEIEAPQFGELVYYYQLSLDGKAMQQKLFAFDLDPARARNAMQPTILPPGMYPADLHTQPDVWATLNPEKTGTLPAACALEWRADDATSAWQYSAISLPRNCRFESPSFGGTIKGYIRYDFSPSALRWAERLVADSGELMAETPRPLVATRVATP